MRRRPMLVSSCYRSSLFHCFKRAFKHDVKWLRMTQAVAPRHCATADLSSVATLALRGSATNGWKIVSSAFNFTPHTKKRTYRAYFSGMAWRLSFPRSEDTFGLTWPDRTSLLIHVLVISVQYFILTIEWLMLLKIYECETYHSDASTRARFLSLGICVWFNTWFTHPNTINVRMCDYCT